MELLGTHKVTFGQLRLLAIQCHALDISAYHLLLDSTHTDGVEKTQEIFEELFTSQLLSLAIALRTKFNQGLDHKATVPYMSCCGLLYKYKKNGKEETINFSMKDVCDKIIHAERISRQLETGVQKPTTSLLGTNNRDKSNWELSMSLSLFSEAVLNWIHSVDR